MTFIRANFPPVTEEERQFILDGSIIEAIKSYRARAGVKKVLPCEDCSPITVHNISLKDAKAVIDFEQEALLGVHGALRLRIRKVVRLFATNLSGELGVPLSDVLKIYAEEIAAASKDYGGR